MNLSRELSLRLPGSLPPALKGVFLGEAKQRSPSFLHLRVFFSLSIMSLSLLPTVSPNHTSRKLTDSGSLGFPTRQIFTPIHQSIQALLIGHSRREALLAEKQTPKNQTHAKGLMSATSNSTSSLPLGCKKPIGHKTFQADARGGPTRKPRRRQR